MDQDKLRALLAELQSGGRSVEDVLGALKHLPYADLGYARVDHHRSLRQGLPEVVLGLGKTPEQIAGIARRLVEAEQNVLITRLSPEQGAAVRELLPVLQLHPIAGVATYEHAPIPQRTKVPVALVTAGTSDLPVAEEAAETLRMAGVPHVRVFDVGVAGIHRLFGSLEVLTAAPAVIVVAGMEGALPSVVGGLVACPVIAVPTSIGYGAAFAGVTALCGMLTGCAAGVTVVNIDNGFGAAMAVLRLLAQPAGAPSP